MGNDGSSRRALGAARVGTHRCAAVGRPLTLMVAAMLAASLGHAQQVPSTQQIIEALKPSPSRSLRNLVVRDRPAEAGTAGTAAAPAAAPAAIDLTIEFDFASSRIRAENRPLLANLVAALQSPQLQHSRFLVEGHTDAVGSAPRNLKLSVERAEEVRRFLVTSGVTSERVTAAGRGATMPANEHDPNADENRRVRIVTLP